MLSYLGNRPLGALASPGTVAWAAASPSSSEPWWFRCRGAPFPAHPDWQRGMPGGRGGKRHRPWQGLTPGSEPCPAAHRWPGASPAAPAPAAGIPRGAGVGSGGRDARRVAGARHKVGAAPSPAPLQQPPRPPGSLAALGGLVRPGCTSRPPELPCPAGGEGSAETPAPGAAAARRAPAGEAPPPLNPWGAGAQPAVPGRSRGAPANPVLGGGGAGHRAEPGLRAGAAPPPRHRPPRPRLPPRGCPRRPHLRPQLGKVGAPPPAPPGQPSASLPLLRGLQEVNLFLEKRLSESV